MMQMTLQAADGPLVRIAPSKGPKPGLRHSSAAECGVTAGWRSADTSALVARIRCHDSRASRQSLTCPASALPAGE